MKLASVLAISLMASTVQAAPKGLYLIGASSVGAVAAIGESIRTTKAQTKTVTAVAVPNKPYVENGKLVAFVVMVQDFDCRGYRTRTVASSANTINGEVVEQDETVQPWVEIKGRSPMLALRNFVCEGNVPYPMPFSDIRAIVALTHSMVRN